MATSPSLVFAINNVKDVSRERRVPAFILPPLNPPTIERIDLPQKKKIIIIKRFVTPELRARARDS